MLICASAILAFSGCSKDVRKSDKPKVHGSNSFMGMLDAHDENLLALPENELEELIAAFGRVAVEEEWAQPGSENEAIIDRVPDSRLAANLVECEYTKRLENVGEGAADTYLQEIEEHYADYKAGVKTADLTLKNSKTRLSGEDFLALCNHYMIDFENPGFHRLGLFYRMQFFKNSNKKINCAVDAIDFFASHPESAKKITIRNILLTSIRDAGFLMEESVLRDSQNEEKVATFFLKQFRPLLEESPEFSGSSFPTEKSNLTRLYLSAVPEIDQLAVDSVNVSIGGLMTLGRIGKYKVNDLDFEGAYGIYTQYVQILDQLAKRNGSIEVQVVVIQELNINISNGLSKAFGNLNLAQKFRRETKNNGTLEALRLLMGDLARADYRFVNTHFPDDSEQCWNRTEKQLEILLLVKAYKSAESILETYIQDYSDTIWARRAYLRLAKLYDENINVQSKSLETLARLREIHPGTDEANLSMVRSTVILSKMNQSQQALQMAQSFIQDNPGDRRIPNMIYIVGLNQADLGSHGAAVESMHVILEKYTTNNVAVHAYLWLVNHYLSNNEYEQARVYAEELIQRFPGSQEAREVKKISLIRKRMGQ